MDSKLPNVGTTIFTVMNQLAHDCDAINLSQGFPSFNPDPQLLALVDHHLQTGANQYAPMPVEQQVAIIYAGTQGLVDEVAVDQVGTYEREMFPWLRDTHPDVLREIRETGDLSPAVEQKLKKALSQFGKEFVLKHRSS